MTSYRFDLFVNKWIFDFLKKKFFESCTRSHSAWRNRWVSFRSQINTCGSTFRKSYPGETRYPSPVMKKSIVSFLKSWAQINSRMDSDQIDFSRVCYTSLRFYILSEELYKWLRWLDFCKHLFPALIMEFFPQPKKLF